MITSFLHTGNQFSPSLAKYNTSEFGKTNYLDNYNHYKHNHTLSEVSKSYFHSPYSFLRVEYLYRGKNKHCYTKGNIQFALKSNFL